MKTFQGVLVSLAQSQGGEWQTNDVGLELARMMKGLKKIPAKYATSLVHMALLGTDFLNQTEI